MKLGFHISIAGGLKNVVKRAQALQCTTIQLFTRSPRGWDYRTLSEEDVTIFKKHIREGEISPVFVHMPYLINCASSNRELYQRSLESMIVDLDRAHLIGAQYAIVHAGSSPDTEKGIERMVTCIDQALKRAKNEVVLLIENTPGSGHEIGCTIDQLARILKNVIFPQRVGIVFDTAHAAAAGYDLATVKGVNRTIRDIRKMIGMERLHLVHLNDLKTKPGARNDQHWHIGKGSIGKGIRYIVTHRLLQDVPFIMETPRESIKDDIKNMKTVKRYLKEANNIP